jgi:hypothetical protein
MVLPAFGAAQRSSLMTRCFRFPNQKGSDSGVDELGISYRLFAIAPGSPASSEGVAPGLQRPLTLNCYVERA